MLPPPPNLAAIEAHGLTRSFGPSVLALDAVDLAVHQNEILGFLGPNGAGKTTFIRILLDLIRPTRGSARVLGLDCQKEAHKVRERVGFVPSDPTFYRSLTAREQIRLFAGLRPGAVDWTWVDRLCDMLEVAQDRQVRALSRGNRQKVALVIALMHRPEVLILDEPTTGLDPLMQRRVLDLLREVRDQGRTIFFSSHILQEVERLCDRVAIIRDGRIVTVQDIAALRASWVQHLRFAFGHPVPVAAFTGLPGVVGTTPAGGESVVLDIQVRGDVDAVVKAAAEHHVLALEAAQPSLEDAFMTYYRHDDAPAPVEPR